MSLYVLFLSFSRSPISVAAAAIYMASQASDEKRSQKGSYERFFLSWLWNTVLWSVYCCLWNQELYSSSLLKNFTQVVCHIVPVLTGNNWGFIIFTVSPPPPAGLMQSLRLSITRGLQNSKLDQQMRFSLPSIKCSAAPPRFRLLPSTASLSELIFPAIWLPRTRQSSEYQEPPIMWLMVLKNAFVGY